MSVASMRVESIGAMPGNNQVHCAIFVVSCRFTNPNKPSLFGVVISIRWRTEAAHLSKGSHHLWIDSSLLGKRSSPTGNINSQYLPDSLPCWEKNKKKRRKASTLSAARSLPAVIIIFTWLLSSSLLFSSLRSSSFIDQGNLQVN